MNSSKKKKRATIPAHHLRNEPQHDANHGWAGLCSCEQVYCTFWPLNFLGQRFVVELPKQAQPPSPHPRRTTAAATQLPPHLVCSGGMDWLLRRRATRSHTRRSSRADEARERAEPGGCTQADAFRPRGDCFRLGGSALGLSRRPGASPDPQRGVLQNSGAVTFNSTQA